MVHIATLPTLQGKGAHIAKGESMAIGLNELFTEMNRLGLTFRRTAGGEIEVAGDLSKLTTGIRDAIREHRGALLSCLPSAAPASPRKSAATPNARAAANAIRQHLDEFGRWLTQFAAWAQPQLLRSIDARLSEAIDTQRPEVVVRQIEAIRQEIEAINWAENILPMTYETEAKHAAAAGAGPAGGALQPDGIPF